MSAAAALDPVLHFVDSLTPGPALEAAARIDGLPLGQRAGLSLAGVPFLAETGTTVVASPVVGRLVHAGAVLLGTSTRPDPAAVCQPGAGTDTSTPATRGGPTGRRQVTGGRGGRGGTRGDTCRHRRRGLSRLAPDPGRVLRRDRTERHLGARPAPRRTVPGPADSHRHNRRGPGRYGSGHQHRQRPGSALRQWPVPAAAGVQLTVGFSADLGYARPDAAVAGLVTGRLQALAAAGMIRLREVAVRLADPAAGWLPLAALDRGEVADLSQAARGSLGIRAPANGWQSGFC
jgi:hypothetical protein